MKPFEMLVPSSVKSEQQQPPTYDVKPSLEIMERSRNLLHTIWQPQIQLTQLEKDMKFLLKGCDDISKNSSRFDRMSDTIVNDSEHDFDKDITDSHLTVATVSNRTTKRKGFYSEDFSDDEALPSKSDQSKQSRKGQKKARKMSKEPTKVSHSEMGGQHDYWKVNPGEGRSYKMGGDPKKQSEKVEDREGERVAVVVANLCA